MGYITKYGSFWGMLPQTSGRVFWVASAASYTVEGNTYTASDSNDGLSPERALLTVNQAVTNATASVGDVIVLLPGSHSWSATQTISKAGLIITGIPGTTSGFNSRSTGTSVRAQSRTTTSASAAVFTVTAADVEFAYLHVVPAAGFAGFAPSAAADRLFIHDCTFNMTTAGNTATIGVDVTFTGTSNSLDDLLVRNCYFYVEGAQGPIVLASGTCAGLTIENCTTVLGGATAWADAVLESVICLGTIIRDCDFTQRVAGTVMTDVIDVAASTTDGATTVLRCYFAVGSDPLEVNNVADVQCAENYLTQGAASVGGTLVLST